MPEKDKKLARELSQQEKDQLLRESFLEVRSEMAGFIIQCREKKMLPEDESELHRFVEIAKMDFSVGTPLSKSQLRKSVSEMTAVSDWLAKEIISGMKKDGADMVDVLDMLDQAIELRAILATPRQGEIDAMVARAQHAGISTLADTYKRHMANADVTLSEAVEGISRA